MEPKSDHGNSLPPAFQLGLFTPGLRGGLDQAVEYLHNESGDEFAATRIYTTKGVNSRRAPLRFAATLATVAKDRLSGNLDGAHLNVASKGSTLRKVIVAVVLVMLRVPYVVQVHGGGYQAFWDRNGKLTRTCIRFLFTRARSVLVLGGPFKQLVVEDIGVEEDKVVVVPNGIAAPSRFDPEARAVVPNIVYFGRLHQPKGTYDLVEALAQLKDLSWTCFLAGNGETDQVRDAVAAADLSDRITVESWIDRDDIATWFNRSSIFVLPSYTEAMSISLLEAMSYGLACVATPVGAHREVVRDGENGLLVTPGDVDSLACALESLISDPSLAQRIGDQAQTDFADRYDARSVKRQVEKIYAHSFRPATKNNSLLTTGSTSDES